jgi:CRISPR-associated protein Csd2
MTAITNRYDFVLLFDVTRGNPNGDPDAGNLPRLDPETNHGLVSDVSLKRKIRNYVHIKGDGQAPLAIYVEEASILNEQHRKAYVAQRPGDEKAKTEKKLNPKDDDEAKKITAWMCSQFYDVRTFGAVMSTGINAGQVRGPVQLGFAQSIEPIVPQEISITRMAATTEADKKQRADGSEEGNDRTDNRTMGRKFIVPYGLYRVHGHVSAHLAARTGFSDEDLALLLEALGNMFEHDHSAARGEMSSRRLVVFKHASALGQAPAHKLFDRVSVGRSIDGEARLIDRSLDNYPVARAYSDYAVTIDRDDLPEGIEILDLI